MAQSLAAPPPACMQSLQKKHDTEQGPAHTTAIQPPRFTHGCIQLTTALTHSLPVVTLPDWRCS